MTTTLRRTATTSALAACTSLAALSLLPVASAQAAAPAAGPTHGPSLGTASPATYWTSERMKQARSVDVAVSPDQASSLRAATTEVERGLPGRAAPHVVRQAGAARGGAPGFGSGAQPWYGSTSAAPATTSGRVFYTGNDGLGYSCSASTVNSGGKNLVFTAGHCVHPGAGGTWHRNWVFVPGYNNGSAPYGRWTSKQLWSWTLWTRNTDRAYDFGVAVMNTDGAGRRIVDVVGGQGIEWNYPLSQFVYQFGYPARSPFNGGTLQYCTGTTYSDGGHQGNNCTMTEGASGGPWLDDFSGRLGWLDSVNSWVFWDGNGNRYKWNGPYFGNAVRDLYTTTANL